MASITKTAAALMRAGPVRGPSPAGSHTGTTGDSRGEGGWARRKEDAGCGVVVAGGCGCLHLSMRRTLHNRMLSRVLRAVPLLPMGKLCHLQNVLP